MEDATLTVGSGWTSVTRYGLGARGIDYMENPAANGGWTAFPVYDAHGNMVATLARSGNNSYSLGNQRSFDAWGAVRLGAQSGDPSGRYCANLGHKQDDESGLIYMRARYYEPGSGRFVSQDGEMQGTNWFSYCANQPVTKGDRSGAEWNADDRNQFGLWFTAGVLAYFACVCTIASVPTAAKLTAKEQEWIVIGVVAAAGAFNNAYSFSPMSAASKTWVSCLPWALPIATGIALEIWTGQHTSTWVHAATLSLGLYDTVLLGMLIGISNTM
jgi:RHS repeat-associated protein